MAITLGLDTWIIRILCERANHHRGLGSNCLPGGTKMLISAVAHYISLGGAECHLCVHPQLRCSMHCPEAYIT